MKKILLFAVTAFSLSTQAQTTQSVAATGDTIANLTFPGFKQPTKPTTYATYTGIDSLVKVTVKYKTKQLAGNTNADTIITVVKDSVKIANSKKIRYFYQSFNPAQNQYAINLGIGSSFGTFANTADNNNTVMAASSNYPPGVANTTADNWVLIGPITVPAKAMTCKFAYGFINDVKRDGFEIRTIEASKLDASPNYAFIPNNGNYGAYDSLQLVDFSTNNPYLDSTQFFNTMYNTFKQSTLMAAPVVQSYSDNDVALKAPGTTAYPAYGFTFDKAKMFTKAINMTAYRGLDVYVAIHHNATQQDLVFFDDILFREANLAAPIGLNSLAVNDNVIVYPNPANDVLNIIGADNGQITLTNMLGEIVKTVANTTTLNIADITAGMYIVTVVKNNETITKKIIKN
jgi:hypothetical protein